MGPRSWGHVVLVERCGAMAPPSPSARSRSWPLHSDRLAPSMRGLRQGTGSPTPTCVRSPPPAACGASSPAASVLLSLLQRTRSQRRRRRPRMCGPGCGRWEQDWSVMQGAHAGWSLCGSLQGGELEVPQKTCTYVHLLFLRSVCFGLCLQGKAWMAVSSSDMFASPMSPGMCETRRGSGDDAQ